MSALLDAKQATYDLLTGWSWPTRAPTISWGAPTKSEDTNTPMGEHVYLGVADIEVPDESLGFGRERWDVELTVRVFIDVYQAGDDERACEQRADELYGEIVKVFARNAGRDGQPALNGSVDRVTGWTSGRLISPVQDGWMCRISIEQSCVAVTTQIP